MSCLARLAKVPDRVARKPWRRWLTGSVVILDDASGLSSVAAKPPKRVSQKYGYSLPEEYTSLLDRLKERRPLEQLSRERDERDERDEMDERENSRQRNREFWSTARAFAKQRLAGSSPDSSPSELRVAKLHESLWLEELRTHLELQRWSTTVEEIQFSRKGLAQLEISKIFDQFPHAFEALHRGVRVKIRSGDGEEFSSAVQPGSGSGTLLASLEGLENAQGPYQVDFLPMRFPQRAMHRALDSGRAGEVLNEVQNGDEKDAECQTEQSISLPGSLNSCQKRAICSALHSRSRLPTVIWGPPGTGKSTLAAFLIWQLVQNPRAQVLATAPSNTGADVLCAKLAKIGLDESRMLRLNALGRDVKTVPEEIQAYGFTSYVEGRSVFQIPSLPKLQSYRVVVATCICAAHIAEVMRREGGSAWFSHVVVDEAAEATEPETLVPAQLASREGRLILLGDHFQLGPLVLSSVARRIANLDESMIQRLANERFHAAEGLSRDTLAVCETKDLFFLTESFRSHPDILEIYSKVFYSGQLEHRHRRVQNRLLPFFQAQGCHSPIIMHNVVGQEGSDTGSPSLFNLEEVRIVQHYVLELLAATGPDNRPLLAPEDIGIITPYAGQVQRLQRELSAQSSTFSDIEVGTVEHFQGQEKSVVILSAVRCQNGKEETARPLAEIASTAHDGDNCAIATSPLRKGTRFAWKGSVHRLSHALLEGHRFALEHIAEGESLTSWSLPFGTALRSLKPGDYCCNGLMLKALKGRRDVDFHLPETPNFSDPDTSASCPFHFDESTFVAGKQASLDLAADSTFEGFARTGGRGVGTRNKVVLIALTVSSASFVRALEAKMTSLESPNLDGVVAVAHNEGESKVQNNKELLLRTIAGFIVHPNTGAALVVSTGQERSVGLSELKKCLQAYPADHVPHEFLELSGSWQADLQRAQEAVEQRLAPRAAEYCRSTQPVSALCIALQCGGSDAFSGITGNPLVGEIAKLLLVRGGLALLAESPELVGAEPYILANCRTLEVARSFLNLTERYKQYASRHGQDAAGNPSGGNLFRGLYNIVIKSLGASRKKPPDVCLDRCIEYGERVGGNESGYYFMDSPGNDLESIAGQVASGCNVIFFVTGNGAITNFPFVPTLKVVTTSGRFKILEKDMDINAGLLNEGMTMNDLAAQVYSLMMIRVASGMHSKGEMAGISQVSIWRNWFLDESQQVSDLQAEFNYEQRDLEGTALKVKQEWLPALSESSECFLKDVRSKGSLPPIGLILPTSLCSSEVARLASRRLNEELKVTDESGLEVRFVALPHSEGCGGSGGEQSETIFQRVMLGHLLHPQIQQGFLLEHGCEKTHNDWFAARLERRQGKSLDSFGWASVQSDGGIEAVYQIIADFFKARQPPRPPAEPSALRLALLGDAAPQHAPLLAALTRKVVLAGGTVLLAASSPLLANHAFTGACLYEELPEKLLPPTVAYAQVPTPGLHVMEVPSTASYLEVVCGMAPGVHCFLAWEAALGGGCRPPAHPFVPTVTMSAEPHPDVDVVIEPEDMAKALEAMLLAIQKAVHGGPTKVAAQGATDFSVPRGITAVSL
ncbi:unnamed protein product [Effrenium voratum]|nr:unnamed protein product [Effrenium voratum]